ncbi:hypothetical protein HKX48_000828 [Thoreauomyces humboldtii]|nr:hypothetical protein HKX48_000828 [Thoreauomyces humboldtii]
MSFTLSTAVNVLILASAVSIPAAISYQALDSLPDLATIATLCFLSLCIFRILGVPSLVESIAHPLHSQAALIGHVQEEDGVNGLLKMELEARLLKERREKLAHASESAEPKPEIFPAAVHAPSEILLEGIPPAATPDDPYISRYPELEREFLALADTKASPSSPPGTPGAVWATVLKQSWGNFSICIDSMVGKEFFFRYSMAMEGTPEEVFDLLGDITRRTNWDELCQEAGVIEQVSNRTTVQYFRTKGVWPTKSRAALVVAFTKRLGEGHYLNVTQSIDDHPQFNAKSSDVRMLARIAGQVIQPDPEGRPRMCRVVQVVDGDLGGWLPKGVVGMVTTQAIPVGMRKANKMLRKIQTQRTASVLIAAAEGEPLPVEERRSSIIKSSSLSDPSPVGGPLVPVGKVASTVVPVLIDAPPSAESHSALLVAPKPTTPVLSRTVLRKPDAQLRVRPNVLKYILNILSRSQPWVIVSFLLAVITGRFKR